MKEWQKQLQPLQKKRNDIELTVQTGDLSTGKNIAIELSHNNYDVIISRGGTAELIRSAVEIPVVEVSISVYDVLRAIKLAENYSGKFVIAGFRALHTMLDYFVICYNMILILLHLQVKKMPFLHCVMPKRKVVNWFFVIC